MPQFVPVTSAKDAPLSPGARLDLPFKVRNAGPVDLTGRAVTTPGIGPSTPVPIRIELFRPGAGTPVVAQNGGSSALPTTASFDASAADAALGGNWNARLTNTGSKSCRAVLRVSAPGTLPVRETRIPADAIATLVNVVLGQVGILITAGPNASRISFPPGLDLPDRRFTIDDVAPGVLRERPNDIRSSSIELRLIDATSQRPRGTLRLEIAFEDQGPEITGTFDVELNQMKLRVDLALGVFGCGLSYDGVAAEFSAEIDIKRLPDRVVDAVLHHKRKIAEGVESAITGALSDFRTCQRVSAALTSAVTPLLGENGFIADAKIAGGELVLTSFNVV